MSAKGRKSIVCIECGCTQCPIRRRDIPDDCEYKVYHLLELSRPDGEVVVAGRRSGKTTSLVGLANRYAAAGVPSVLVTVSMDMCRVIKRNHRLHPKVDVVSVQQLRNKPIQDAFLFVDEVGDDEWENAGKVAEMGGCVVVSRRFTP